MELVPDIRYFINKNQKAFNFFGLDLVNQVLLPGILPGNGTDIRYQVQFQVLFQLLCGLDLVMELIQWTGTSNGTENKNLVGPSTGTEIRYIPDTE